MLGKKILCLLKDRKTDKYNPFTILMQIDPQNPKWEADIKIRILPWGEWGKAQKCQCGVHIMGFMLISNIKPQW